MRATAPPLRGAAWPRVRFAPPPVAATNGDDRATTPTSVAPGILFVAAAAATAAAATAAWPNLEDAFLGDGVTTGVGVAAAGAPADAVAAALWAAALRLASPAQLLLTTPGRSEGDAPSARARAALGAAGLPPAAAAAAELVLATAAGVAAAAACRTSLGDGIWGIASGLAALTTAAGAALGRPPPPPPPDVAAALEARAAAFQAWADGGGLARRGGCHESEVVAAWRAAARRVGVVDAGDDADVSLLVRAWGGRRVSRTPGGFLKNVSVSDRGLGG